MKVAIQVAQVAAMDSVADWAEGAAVVEGADSSEVVDVDLAVAVEVAMAVC